jgi:hypothetical protein
MIQLAELFQDLEAQVIIQEPAVTQIEQKGEEVNDNVGKANVEIDGAIAKARSRNRKKWWCLLIIRKYSLRRGECRYQQLTSLYSTHHHHCGCRCCGGQGGQQDHQMIAAFVRKKFAVNTTSVGGLAFVPREDRSTGCYLYLGPLGIPVSVRSRPLFHNFNLVFSPGLQRQ